MSADRLVAVGCSWGGLDAVGELLGALSADFPAAVAIAQHRSIDSQEGALAGLLARRSALPVSDAGDKEQIVPGRAYLAPPDYHLLVEDDGFALSVDERVRFARPSIDVLFESAADVYAERLVAVVLTGANDDGAQGVRAVKAHGGTTVAQDPAEAERAEMPEAAIATGAIDRVLPLDEIAPALLDLCGAAV